VSATLLKTVKLMHMLCENYAAKAMATKGKGRPRLL